MYLVAASTCASSPQSSALADCDLHGDPEHQPGARCLQQQEHIYRGPARSALTRCTTSVSITLIGFYASFWGPSSALGSFLLFWDAFLVFGVLLLLGVVFIGFHVFCDEKIHRIASKLETNTC